MAKVLICYFSDYGEAMYDAISNVLRKNGNDVFRLNINSNGFECDSWGGKSSFKNKSVIEQIKNFSPDLVFNFNHSLPWEIETFLTDKCKICIVDADNPQTFWNKEQLNRDKDKYYYLGLQKYSKDMYEKFVGLKMTNKNYLFFPPATVVKNKKLKQDKNISFIGSNFYPLSIPEVDGFYDKIGLELYHEFKKDYFYPIEKAQERFGNKVRNIDGLFKIVQHYYVGQDRLKFMSSIADLGFVYYGVRWWNKIAYYDFELADCFDETPKVTLEDNEWVYNTSKISINISHPQAKSSFSWRVMDIMASGACLLMEDKPDWRELFAPYLSDETLENVIYKDRFDMREKAKKLLADEKLRLRCVADLNNAIEQNGRWENRFAMLEKFLGINLLNNKNNSPEYIFIKRDEKVVHNANKEAKLHHKKTFVQRMKFKQRGKNIFYLSCLILAQIPVVDLLFKKKRRQKLLNKVMQYWR